ncbi:MAG: DUF3606 domain-containing protein [Betaproteobacteria bacterium]
MSDDKSKSGPTDRNRIDMNETFWVRDWSEKLGVSKEELAAAVKRVGLMVRDVEVI